MCVLKCDFNAKTSLFDSLLMEFNSKRDTKVKLTIAAGPEKHNESGMVMQLLP